MKDTLAIIMSIILTTAILFFFFGKTEPPKPIISEKIKVVENTNKIDSLELALSKLSIKKIANYRTIEVYRTKYLNDTIVKHSADTVIMSQDSLIDTLEEEAIDYSKSLYLCKENAKIQTDMLYNDSIEIERYKIKQKKQNFITTVSSCVAGVALIFTLIK